MLQSNAYMRPVDVGLFIQWLGCSTFDYFNKNVAERHSILDPGH